MKFQGYAIVSDLDGTLFSRNQTVPERSVKAIEYFKENGGIFTVATGRDIMFIERRFPFLIDMVNAPVITSNGACVYDFSRNITHIDLTMGDGILELLDALKIRFPDALIEIFTHNKIIVINPDEHSEQRFEKMKDLVVFTNEHILPSDPIMRVTVMERDENKLNRIAEFIKNISCNESFEFVFSESHIFEILPYDASKGNGVKYLRKLFGDNIKIISAGDWSNDISQLEAADVAVCPSNAKKEIRDFCKHTLCDCDEGIIADIVALIENELI